MSKEHYRKWYYANLERARALKAENMRRYRAASREKYAARSRRAKRMLREKLLDTFGSRCVLCGFSDERALTLDHINNNGAEERSELGERGVYYRALKPEYQSEYRMLCMNCQFIARHEAGRQNQHPGVAGLAWRILSGGSK
jgi:hypothetical protein